MAYLPMRISEAVNQINVKYFLPHIQREMVWEQKQMIKLFDSLMRGYPISTFLFWKIDQKAARNISKLEFIKDYQKGASKNQHNGDSSRDEYCLVLDGQQRLQAFYIALKGSYNQKELFFNALSKKPIDEEEEDDEEIIFETKFMKSRKQYVLEDGSDKSAGEKKLWIKLKAFGLLDKDSLYDFADIVQKEHGNSLYANEARLVDKNLKEMNRIIMDVETIFFFQEIDNDYDRVLDIFIRTNSSGTKLSKSDLLFSMIKLKWSNDAYDEFNNLTAKINRQGDFDFDNDFILKTALVLIGTDIKYKVENFNDANIQLIEDKWDNIKASITCVVDFARDYAGITTKKMLPSKNALIPLINYTYTNNIRTYESDKEGMRENKQLMRAWLYNALLATIFSGQTDEVLRKCRECISMNKSGLFPAQLINASLPRGKVAFLKFEDFSKIEYADNESFFALGILQPEINPNPVADRNRPHKDHIFPMDLVKTHYSDEMINNIGNLQLLTSTENEAKKAMPFDEWIKTRDERFIEKHFIPKDKTLWRTDKFSEFVEARKKLMYDEIKSVVQ